MLQVQPSEIWARLKESLDSGVASKIIEQRNNSAQENIDAMTRRRKVRACACVWRMHVF